MRTIRKFEFLNARTIDEAVNTLAAYKGKAWPFAGGTDILRMMRFQPLPENLYPEVLINLKTISPSLEYIKEEDGILSIGALTKLVDIANNALVGERYSALANAANKVASPQIRNMATISGNICQLTHCLYFSKPDNRFHCLRKGGSECPAQLGDNRYCSIFGDVNGCVAVNTSDIAPALIALNARIKTNKRMVNAGEFWDVRVPGSTILDEDEIVVEIQVPRPPPDAKSVFMKFSIRSSIDFPIVNGAALIGDGVARIALNAVAPKPYRATKAEEVLKGKTIDETAAEEAAIAAVSEASPLSFNKWKISVAKAIVKRMVLNTKSR